MIIYIRKSILPWTPSTWSSENGKVIVSSEAAPLSEEALALYLTLLCETNQTNMITCGLRVIQDRMHNKEAPKAFVKHCCEVLTSIFVRGQSQCDYYMVMPTDKTTKSTELSITDALYFSVERKGWDSRDIKDGFFSVDTNDIERISNNTTTYAAYLNTVMMFIRLRSKMYAYGYTGADGKNATGFAVHVGIDDIENEVTLKRKSVINYLQALEDMGIILHSRGSAGRHSTYVYPASENLLNTVLNPMKRPDWTKSKNYRGPV